MSPLEFRIPPKTPHLNLMLYGPPKIGKTTAALSAPGPVLLLTGEAPNATMFARTLHPPEHVREVLVTSPDVLLEAISYAEAGDVDTVVLDTVGSVFQTLLEAASGGGKPTLPQYGDVTTAIERFARAMLVVDCNFVIVCHDYGVKDEETGAVERLPYTGTNNPALGGKLMAQVDVLGYCGRAKSQTTGDVTYVAQLFAGGGRRGGDRTDVLGENRALDLSEWIDTYRQAIAPAKTSARERGEEAVAA